jgi:signal transduction histidine kinase
VRDLRISLRGRLTLVYGSLFCVTAFVLVAVTYLFTVWAVNAKFRTEVPGQSQPANQRFFFGGPDVERLLADRRREILHELLQASVLAALALGILAFVVGYFIAGRMLRPLQTVTSTARLLSESNLHERIVLTGPRDEIKELADTFNGMLDRLHRAFDSQRRFIANASHELRTPLAISRTAIELLLERGGTAPEVNALHEKLLIINTRHERLIDGLLTLARSERELRNRAPVDVTDLTTDAIDQLSPAAAKVGVGIDHTPVPGPTAGDPVLLEQAVVNLIENAIKYNMPDGKVWVSTGEAAGQAFVTVENTGPSMSAEDAQVIFEPFRRLRGPRRRSERGAGLGLSIVRAVMAAHNGSVAAWPRPQGGLTVTLQFPAARRTEPHPSEPAVRSRR